MANLCVPIRSKKIPKGNIKKKTPDEVYGFITNHAGKDETYGFVSYNPKSGKQRRIRFNLTPETRHQDEIDETYIREHQENIKNIQKSAHKEHLKVLEAYTELKAIKITNDDNTDGDIQTVKGDTETAEIEEESKHVPIYGNVSNENGVFCIKDVTPVGSKIEQPLTGASTDKAQSGGTYKGSHLVGLVTGYRAHPPYVETHPPGLFKATMIHIPEATDSSDTASSRLQYLTTSTDDSSEDDSALWSRGRPHDVIKVSDTRNSDKATGKIQTNAYDDEDLNTSELQRFNYNGVLDIIKEYENDPKERFAKTRKLPKENTPKLLEDTSDYVSPPPLPPKIIYVQASDVTKTTEIKHNDACHNKSKSSENTQEQRDKTQHSAAQLNSVANNKTCEIDTITDNNDSGNDSPKDRSNNSENISINSSIDAELDRWLSEQKGEKPPLPPRVHRTSANDNIHQRQSINPQELYVNGVEQLVETPKPIIDAATREIRDTPESPGKSYETIDSWLDEQKNKPTDKPKANKDSYNKVSKESINKGVDYFKSCDPNLEKWLSEQKSKKPKENEKQPKVNLKLRKNVSQKETSVSEGKISRSSTESSARTVSTPALPSIIVSPRAYVKDTSSMTLADIIECLQHANSLKPVYIKMHVRAEYTPDDDWTAKDEIKVESETIVNALYKQGEWAFVRTEDERGGFVPYKNLEPVNYRPIKVNDFCQQFPDGFGRVIKALNDDHAFMPNEQHQNDTASVTQGSQITQTVNNDITDENIYVEMNSPITISHERSRSLPEKLNSPPSLSPRTKPLSSMKPCGCSNQHYCKASNIRTQHDPNGVNESVLKRINKKGEINKILRVRSKNKKGSKPSCQRKLNSDSSVPSAKQTVNPSARKSSSNRQQIMAQLQERRCSEDSLLSPIAAAKLYLHDSDDSEVFNAENTPANYNKNKNIATVKNNNQKTSVNLERLRNLKVQLAGINASDIADDLVQESIDMLENHLQNQLQKQPICLPEANPIEVDQGSTDSKEFIGEMLVEADRTFIEHSIHSENAGLDQARGLLSPELFSEDMEISQQASSGHGTLSSNVEEGVAQGMESQSSRSQMKSQDSLERCKSWLDELYSKSHDHSQRRTSAPSIQYKTQKRTKKSKTQDPFGLLGDLSPIVAPSENKSFEAGTFKAKSPDSEVLYQNTKFRDILFNDGDEPNYEDHVLKNSKRNLPLKTMSDAIRGYESSTNTMETVIYNKSKAPKTSKQPRSESERSRSTKVELKIVGIFNNEATKENLTDEPITHLNQQINTSDQLTVLFDFEAKQRDDLTVKQKDVVTVVENKDPQWVLVENSVGHQGYIPKSYTTNLVKLHLDPKAKTTYF